LIKYRSGKRIAREKLAELYQSVRWLHWKTSQKLQQAYLNSDFVVTAWDGDRLAGAGRALTDGFFNAYLPDIAVHPDYRGAGVGRKIIMMLLEKCSTFYNITAVAEDRMAEEFFRNCGLKDERKAFRIMRPITA
jgi:GNAT superfamily N-acetyltransferase